MAPGNVTIVVGLKRFARTLSKTKRRETASDGPVITVQKEV